MGQTSVNDIKAHLRGLENQAKQLHSTKSDDEVQLLHVYQKSSYQASNYISKLLCMVLLGIVFMMICAKILNSTILHLYIVGVTLAVISLFFVIRSIRINRSLMYVKIEMIRRGLSTE